MNALYWIKKEDNWATFIANRVNGIWKLTDPEAWKFNPTDLPSRRCNLKALLKSHWWDAVSIPLPEDRVRDAAVFVATGIDLCGPLFLKTDNKCWIVLAPCAVYRTVHLELVSSLSTECFILALRWFIAKRGRPTTIYSDNGKNLVGTSNLLQKIDWEKIENFASEKRISWKFSPPAAPWWGGSWERLIGLLKSILRKVLGKACLSEEELVTVLCDAESLINSRPLTYL
ncbi:integrase catalytic domain-containing protein [Trichonephila clavipes]|uniref:Integrase catalytic domain-containing protein n=1 Tax=Trichonephila clavipes TaxID=2585209 RepID=A0A8X6S9B3_TRICX|nr:integrase catalytic domain-containing protein [Trichonephila clavipes]